MDRRYIELIAANFPYELPKLYKRLVNICFIVVIAGVFVLFANREYTLYGFGLGLLGGMGMIGIGIMGVLFRKKKAKEFLLNYEYTKKLPEWPEDRKAIESPQPNN